MVRWFWPGGDIDSAQLRREIGILDEAHFGGAEIQPFRFGLDSATPADVLQRVNDYRTPSFYRKVRAALLEASDRNMRIDYTFGSGWPFGGGLNITPELAAVELRAASRQASGPGRFEGKIAWPARRRGFGTLIAEATGWKDEFPAGWDARLARRERLVAVVAIRGTAPVVEPSGRNDLIGNPILEVKRRGVLEPGSAVVLTERVAADRTLDWMVPEGTWQVFSLVQFPVDQRVLAGVGGTPQLVLDHFNRRAIESHLGAVGDSLLRHVGEFAGGSLRGVFYDSLELAGDLNWTEDFLPEFRRRRGYDLTPLLPLLDPAYDPAEIGSLVRQDYAATISDLLIDRHFVPFTTWASRHGLNSRVQAHGSPGDELRIYGLASFPETENLYGGGRYDLLKVAGSAARGYGRSITSAESFVWIMEEYQTTPEKMKRAADEMLAAGVTEIVASGFPYEYLDRPEPGWYPFVSPFPYSSHLNPHDPFWRFLTPLNDYLTRLQYLLRAGEKVAPVALLVPSLGYPTDPRSAVAQVAGRLLAAGHDFDHLNADLLLRSRVENSLLVAPGGARYEVLVLVGAERLPLEVVERVSRFAQTGLPIVVVGTLPSGEVGYRDHQERTRRIATLSDSLSRRPVVRVVPGVDQLVDAVRATAAPNLVVTDPLDQVNFLEKTIGPLEVIFLRNGGDSRRSLRLTVPRASGLAERWDPWTGTTSPIPPATDGGASYRLVLEPYGSAVLVFDRSRPTLAPGVAGERPPSRTRPLGEGEERWTLTAPGVRSGAGRVLDQLIDWSKDPELRDFSGTAHYAIQFSLDSADLAGSRVELDLGLVRDVAEVRLNGAEGPTLLLRPYRTDVTQWLRPGTNTLEVAVTNPLLNRMIGAGRQLGVLFATSYSRPPSRLPAGLLGPVQLVFTSGSR
jgi:hypothetical protein